MMAGNRTVQAAFAFLLALVIAVSAASPTITSSPSKTAANVFETTFSTFPTNVDTELTTTVDHPSADPTASGVFMIYPFVQNFDISEGLSYTINVTSDENDVAVYCWYPVSGNYGLLPRVLFYVTIFAALVLRHHQWLYAGALVASLTYSGTAAIQVCLMVWRGESFGDLDMIPILSILGTSCALTVPLLNWSETLRNIGKNENRTRSGQKQAGAGHSESHEKDQEFNSASRAIVLFWGFLVMVGFLCVFVAVVPLQFTDNFHNWSLTEEGAGGYNITCAPNSGNLDLSAGQAPDWDVIVLTNEFIDTNNCINPCNVPSPDGVAIFRSVSDYTSLSFEQISRYITVSEKSSRQRHDDHFVQNYFKYGLLLLPYLLLQGVWASIFGRRTPAQARNMVYAIITRIRFTRKRTPLEPAPRAQKIAAKYLALTSYSWAVFILVVSIPLVIINVCAAEIFMYYLATSETNNHVGAWGSWASVVLTLFAAFLARFHHEIGYLVVLSAYKVAWLFVHPTWLFLQCCGSARRDRSEAKNIFSGEYEKMPDRGLYRDTAGNVTSTVFDTTADFTIRHIRGAWHGLRNEWIQFVEFFKDPDLSRNNQGRVHRLQATQCGCLFGCQCPRGRIPPECRHEQTTCPFYEECSHEDGPCTHTKECMHARKEAQRLGLLNPERRTVAMALGALHGRKLALDVTGTPIPLRPEKKNRPHQSFFSQKPLADSESELDEKEDSSGVAMPHWQDSSRSRGPIPQYHNSVRRMFSRKTRYSRAAPSTSGRPSADSPEEASTMIQVSPIEEYGARHDFVTNKAARAVRVSEEAVHPLLLRDSTISGDAAYQPEHDTRISFPPRAIVTTDSEMSRRKSMAKDLPALPRGPPKTPHTTPNQDNTSVASGISALSPVLSHSHEPMPSAAGENVSPIRPSPHRTIQTSSSNGTKRSISDASPIEHPEGGLTADSDTRQARSSTGLTSSFEQGIMSRHRRSQAYGPDIPRERDAQAASSSAPIPVHMEEPSDNDEDNKTTQHPTEAELPATHTPSDGAALMPPFSDGTTTQSNRSQLSGSQQDAATHLAPAPLQPRPMRHIAELARFPISPRDSTGAFLSPQEKHALLDPPSTSSTPPIALPPLSPPDPLSNVARAGSLVLDDRNPRLSLSAALAGLNRQSGLSSEAQTLGDDAPRSDPPRSDQLRSSTMPTRLHVSSSSVPEDAAGIERAVQRQKSPRPPGYRSTVDYLQVHRPATMMYADEITLRKDEFGVYQLVINGNEIVQPRPNE